MNQFTNLYEKLKKDIIKRINEFKKTWKTNDENIIFKELAFCLFTPQSNARSCGKAIDLLEEKNLLFNGNAEQISTEINIVRFRNNKARYLVEAREKFINGEYNLISIIKSFNNNIERREWLVKNIKGIGYKEASHFLRNIGFSEDLAILDRHILRTMVKNNIIKEIPKSINSKTYHELEIKFRKFSEKLNIPMDHLDMVIWFMQNDEIYK